MNDSSRFCSSSNHKEADVLQAMHLASISSLPFTLKVAVDLGLLDIIAKAADTPPGMVSVAEIVSKLPTNNPDTPSIVHRMLRLFSHSLHRTMQANHRPRWSHPKILRPCISRQIFLQNEDGVPFAALLRLHLEKYVIECWKFLKDVTLKGRFSSKECI